MASKKRRVTIPKVDLSVIVLSVTAVAFYTFSNGDFFIATLVALGSALATTELLISNKPYRVRSTYVVALTVIMWAAFSAFLLQLGATSLYDWIGRHQKVPLTPPPISNVGYVSILCPFLLPTSVGYPVLVNLPVYVRFFSTFPPTVTEFGIILLAFLLTALFLGKGWCGWLCPFGGIGEALRHRHKPMKPYSKAISCIKGVAKGKGLDLSAPGAAQSLRDVKYAIFVVTMLLALVFTVQWFCVFCWAGLLNWFGSPLNIALFVALMAVLFIGLPLLSGNKWCHSICPVGAALSLMDRVTPFRVTIDDKSCNECYACLNVCPTFGLAKAEDGKVVVTDTCDKCMVCIYKCPTGAIDMKMYNLKTDARKFLVPLATISGALWFYWFIMVVYNLARLVMGA